MNKKRCFLLALTILLILGGISCARKAKVPKAGKAGIMDIVRLLPRETQGIFAFDVHRAMALSPASRSLEDKEVAGKLEDFKNKSGLDLRRDVFLIAGGMMQRTPPEPKGIALVNLHYDQEKLLALIKEKNPELKEISYGKTIIYQLREKKKPETGIAFYDESNIFLGEIEAIQAVIDVCEKKAENVFQNPELNSLIKAANTNALVWSAFLLPTEVMAELAKSNPMFSSLEHLHSLVMSFDYKNKNLLAEIKAMGADEAQNKQIAEFLTGIRAMGAMASSKYPEAADLLNRVEISSTPQFVRLFASLPEDLLLKLGDRVKKEAGTSLPKWD